MQYPGYTNGKVILSEGEWFTFKIHNLVKLQDDEWYYVLQDINGLKHFMTARYYENYGFKPSDEIFCKVDRINCTGRIYLEPRHPYYTEGEIYDFEVINITEWHNDQALLVKSFFGNNIEVPVFDMQNVEIKEDKMVRCIIKSIKKGKLFLEIHTS